jgi:TatD DNase family protein
MNLFINIHTHHPSDSRYIEIINIDDPGQIINPGLYSCGIHPWAIGKNEQAIEKLERCLNEKKLIALGEMGIDRAIETDIKLQIDVFIKQHLLAEQFNIPIIIHCVRAYADLLQLHSQLKPSIPWIFHGFNGNLQIASQLIKKGCFLSIGPAIIANLKLQETMVQLPLEHLFFETDTQMISIEEIYLKVAKIRKSPMDLLAPKIQSNFEKLFNQVLSDDQPFA